jgi:hypothetical protein
MLHALHIPAQAASTNGGKPAPDRVPDAGAISDPKSDPDERLTPAQVGERLGVAKRTLANWRGRNATTEKGPSFYKVGGKIIYLAKDIETFLAARRRDNFSSAS